MQEHLSVLLLLLRSSITITALPVATFSYAASPYCQNAANPSPTFSGGGVAGTFSSTAGLVFVSTATGQVDLAASTARYIYCHQYHCSCSRLRHCNCNQFYYHYYSTCCNHFLCRNTFLFFTRCSAVGNSDRNCWWNLFFYCRINHQCSNRRYYSQHKYCRNLYCYLHHGSWWWLCCADCNNFCNHNYSYLLQRSLMQEHLSVLHSLLRRR